MAFWQRVILLASKKYSEALSAGITSPILQNRKVWLTDVNLAKGSPVSVWRAGRLIFATLLHSVGLSASDGWKLEPRACAW